MGNEVSITDAVETTVRIATGIPVRLPRPEEPQPQNTVTTAVPFGHLSATALRIPLIIPGIVGNPSKVLWKEIQILLQSLQSLLSSTSKQDGDGHFILVLLFTAWREYITEVKKALVYEAKDLPESVFIPGGDINRLAWEKVPLTIYVFAHYGDYIDQPHMSVHEGLIMVYRDQSGESKDLVLHRFDLSAEYPEEQSKTDQQQRIKAGRIPSHEYVEEFYLRAMMNAGRHHDLPSELISVLQRTQPNEIVGKLLNFAAGYPNTTPADMATAFLQFNMYNNVHMFQSRSDSLFGSSSGSSSSSSSGSSSSSSSGSSSGSSRDNMLTEMLHIRENLLFGADNFPAYIGTLKNVSLLNVWEVIQKSMREFPKKYSFISANCIQFCTKITDFLKADLNMKENMDDPVLKEILKPINDRIKWLVSV